MNTDTALKSVIDKYKLSDPVPADVRAAMERSRRDNLAKILKKEAYSSLFISAVVSFFLWIKKFGISISITKSAVAVSAAVIIGLSAVTAAGIYVVNKVFEHNTSQKLDMVNEQRNPEEKASIPCAVELLSYNVAVSPVEMEDVSSEVTDTYRLRLVQELKKIRGAKAAINIEKLDENHISSRILSVSIIKLKDPQKETGDNSLYRISARIINSANSQVLLYTSVMAAGEERIAESLAGLAGKISARL